MGKPDLYFSIDVETDGPIPGQNSMLNLGAAAFLAGNEQPVSTFDANLHELDGAAQDADTMAFWARQDPAIWLSIRHEPELAAAAMKRFALWVQDTAQVVGQGSGARPVAVCYPAGFDFTWTYWYLMKFVGASPFGFGCVDVKTLAWAMLRGGPGVHGFKDASKKNFPPAWFDKALKHTHRGVDDAVEQGVTFLRILAQLDAEVIGADKEA